MIVESLIAINLLAAGVQLTRDSRDAYSFQSHQNDTPALIPNSEVVWRTPSIRSYELTAISRYPIFSDDEILLVRALSEAAVPIEIGRQMFSKAKELLTETGYICSDVVPMLAHDADEDVTYLTVKLMVNASLETSLELDTQLTRGLIKSFKKLPERLSFSVYEIA